MTAPSAPKRIVILGGGMAALSTAAALVREQQAAGRPLYDITVYQTGWRVGGKGASGRNREPGLGMRIEEHGLHVWFGCYDKAWQLLQECYAALGRADEMMALFQGQSDTPYMENVGGWKVWPVHFPRKYGSLGDASFARDILGYAEALGRWLLALGGAVAAHHRARTAPPRGLLQRLERDFDGMRAALEERLHALAAVVGATATDAADRADPAERSRGLVEAAEALHALLLGGAPVEATGIDDDLRRLGILFNLALTVLKGLCADRVWHTGFDALDGEDLRSWLQRHGASDETLSSAPVRALYDLCFAYRGGQVGWAQADFAAGAALCTVLRIAIEYPDYVVYEMRAGMGEVVVAPIYQRLRQAGVRFKFFHQVDRLELDPDTLQVRTVHITQQARVLGGGDYDPLFTLDCPADGIASLACWPSLPKYDLLEDGDRLKGYHLESPWSGWPGVGAVTLRAGDDFDLLVLGVSLESARMACADFPPRLPAWGAMFGAMQTVQTASAQLWMTPTLAQLGWQDGAVPIDAGPEPMDVWADRSDLLRRETWAAPAPGSLQYLCGPLDERWSSGLPHDPAFLLAARQAALNTTVQWIEASAAAVWPAAQANGGFDWGVLREPAGATGPARLQAQYVRANVDPSERYVLSVAGSTATRLPADGSGVGNLVLAGDWTHSDWNAGCIEAAVTTGVNAAAAVQRALARGVG